MFLNIKKIITNNYIVILVISILLIAAFYRIYNISDYLTFLGDEGRDVMVVRGILHGDLVFIGPRASAGDFFTGPIYYYMMAPFLLLSNYHPIGPAIMIALLSVATCYLIFRFGREWIGEKGALVAALLYAISPLVIQYSRSSWNPNPMPFFTILILYLLYKFIQKPSILKFIAIGILYGIAFQLHYIMVFVGIIIAAFILVANLMLTLPAGRQGKKDIFVRIVKQYLSIFIGFIIGMSPFLLFELKNGFPNIKTIFRFVFAGEIGETDVTNDSPIQIVWNVFFRLFARLVMYYPPPDKTELYDPTVLTLWGLFAILLGVTSTILITKIKDKFAKLLLALWIGFGVLLFAFYRKPIYDYYFEFMFPLSFILVGNTLAFLFAKKHIYKIAAAIILVLLIYLNWLGYPFRNIGNKQYEQVKMISEFILEKAGGKPFNFALLTLGNSDHAYRYIFEVNGKPPTTIEFPGVDPERKTITDQLFVVCEDPNCQPEGASLWEVAGFGRAKIVEEWPVSVLKVYKLVHFKE